MINYVMVHYVIIKSVHRVARNGRNFEYLSGEDPYLGARLTEQYVSGVQSKGVASVMKHYVFNNQETNRQSESSVVDEKTAWELYYPPFEAGVKAGVSGYVAGASNSRPLASRCLCSLPWHVAGSAHCRDTSVPLLPAMAPRCLC